MLSVPVVQRVQQRPVSPAEYPFSTAHSDNAEESGQAAHDGNSEDRREAKAEGARDEVHDGLVARHAVFDA
jgi:hypothetical protein